MNRRQPSTRTYRFDRTAEARVARSVFDRSHGHKTTFDSGYLVPIYADEAYPGDTFSMRANGFVRMATPIYPIMDNAFVDVHFFAVPIRLLWENWQRFNGEQDDPGDSTDYRVPEVFIGDEVEPDSIHTYLGIPVGYSGPVNALWHRAYNRIWNEWYRDQNLQDSISANTDDGPDGSQYILRRRGKRHDYFTSCLPWPQKGPAVDLPLGIEAPVIPDENYGGASGPAPSFYSSNVGPSQTSTLRFPGPTPDSQNTRWTSEINTAGLAVWQDTALIADLTDATAVTINTLRQAFQIQKMAERDARGGTRYTEILRSHFGVTSPDQRLQRPEFLGGGSAAINVNPVAQTASTDDTSPQGNLAAVVTAYFSGVGFTKSFTEHMVILGLASVRADLTYQQGIERQFLRRTKYDFYWPALAHIGEQAVTRKEIYATGVKEDDDLVFGYQERFAELRYKPSKISGQFSSAAPQSLDSWHLSQYFSSPPVLNTSFIQERPPINRVVAVEDEPEFIADFWFNLRCARPLPIYGTPGNVDRF